MSDSPPPELLMQLSADVMMTLLSNESIDPTSPGIAELAFTHAAKLIGLNLEFRNKTIARLQSNPAVH